MGHTLDALFAGSDPVLLDGGMGTGLREQGWPREADSLLANLEAPGLVASTHAGHVRVGARLVLANSFGAVACHDERALEAVRTGVRIARKAAGARARVGGSVAASHLERGDFKLDDVLATLLDEGVDLVVFETCNTLADAMVALDAWRRVVGSRSVPVVVCATTTDGGHADRKRVMELLHFVQAVADVSVEAGLNCCQGPHETLRVALAAEQMPRWLKPNTGLGHDRVDDNVMAAFARAARQAGARWIGGCCGTDGDTLESMAAALMTEDRSPS